MMALMRFSDDIFKECQCKYGNVTKTIMIHVSLNIDFNTVVILGFGAISHTGNRKR